MQDIFNDKLAFKACNNRNSISTQLTLDVGKTWTFDVNVQ